METSGLIGENVLQILKKNFFLIFLGSLCQCIQEYSETVFRELSQKLEAISADPCVSINYPCVSTEDWAEISPVLEKSTSIESDLLGTRYEHTATQSPSASEMNFVCPFCRRKVMEYASTIPLKSQSMVPSAFLDPCTTIPSKKSPLSLKEQMENLSIIGDSMELVKLEESRKIQESYDEKNSELYSYITRADSEISDYIDGNIPDLPESEVADIFLETFSKRPSFTSDQGVTSLHFDKSDVFCPPVCDMRSTDSKTEIKLQRTCKSSIFSVFRPLIRLNQ